MSTKIFIFKQLFPKKSDVSNRDSSYRIFKAYPVNKNSGLKLDSSGSFSITGDLPFLSEGEQYDVVLKEGKTTKWGTEYNIESVENLQSLENLSLKESEKILSTMASPNNVKTILTHYPTFIHIILTEGKEAIDTSKLYNIKSAKLNSYARKIEEKYKFYSMMQDLKEYNLSLSEVKTLCEKYKTVDAIKNALKQNPYYVLIDVVGRKFIVEGTHKVYGVDVDLVRGANPIRPDLKDSEIRCEYLILEALDRNENGADTFKGGSTKLSAKDMFEYIKSYDKCLNPLVKKVCQECDGVYYDEQSGYVGKMSTYLKEVRIANFIKNILDNPTTLDWDWERFTEIKDGTLSDEQKMLLKSICENRITVLDALAGSGKTSATKAALEMIDYYGYTHTCLSPTGKASKRFTQQTNKKCSTIHVCKLRNGGTNAQVVFLDEDSFLSVDLMCLLIDCIESPETVRLVLVGDRFQIPSISCGRVMGDIIDSGKVNVVTLTKNFRFGEGGKSMVSTKCRNGDFYINEEDMDKDMVVYGKHKDYTFIKSDDTVEQIIDVYESILKDNKCKPQDIWVLSSWNVKDFGSNNINNRIQTLVNPPKRNEEVMCFKLGDNEIALRVNDIVMNTKNNYSCLTKEVYEELLKDDDLSKEDFSGQLEECFNGEVGQVLAVNDSVVEIQFDEKIIVFDKLEAKKLLLGYSINFFKAQGSSNKYIIVLTLPQHSRSLNRQLLYTALTRATDKLYEIGDIKTMQKAVDTLGDFNRETFLGDLLKEV